MTQNERIKEVRKSLGLTLEKFGERIGLKKSAVSLIENGKNSVTDANVKAICREFGVDYIWLTTGDGEMFVDTDDDFIERIDRIMAGEDDARKNLFKFMLELSDEDIEALDRLMKKAIEFTQNNKRKRLTVFQLSVSWVYRYATNLYILLRMRSLCIFPTISIIASL